MLFVLCVQLLRHSYVGEAFIIDFFVYAAPMLLIPLHVQLLSLICLRGQCLCFVCEEARARLTSPPTPPWTGRCLELAAVSHRSVGALCLKQCYQVRSLPAN